jgi:TonB family protein
VLAYTVACGQSHRQPSHEVTPERPPVSVPHTRPPQASGGVFGGHAAPESPYTHPIYRFPVHRSALQPVRNPAVRARPISTPPPVYPEPAARARIRGIVILEIVVDRDGHIAEGRVLKPLPLGLDQAAIDAVRKWRYEPARDGSGNPVPSIFSVTIPMPPTQR